MTIKGFFRWLGILIMIAYLGISNRFCPPVQASILDDLRNEMLSGIMLDGGRHAYIENITFFEPEDKEFAGMSLTSARLKLITDDGKEIIHDLWLIGQLSEPKDENDSPTFYVFYRKVSEPFAIEAGGLGYDFARHWLGKDAPPVYVGILYMDNGNPLYTLYFDVPLNEIFGESTNGYHVRGDVLLGMETLGNRDFLDYQFDAIKDLNAEGTKFMKAFVLNYGGKTVYGFGAGITF